MAEFWIDTACQRRDPRLTVAIRRVVQVLPQASRSVIVIARLPSLRFLDLGLAGGFVVDGVLVFDALARLVAMVRRVIGIRHYCIICISIGLIFYLHHQLVRLLLQ